MNILNRLLKDKKGSNALVGVAILFFSMLIIMLFLEIGRIYLVVNEVQNDMDAANGATWSVVDPNKLAYRIIQFHSDYESRATGDSRARNVFVDYLAKNMNLEATLDPKPGDNRFGGPIVVEEFETILSNDLPMSLPDGITVNKVGVYSKLIIPYRPMFRMFGINVNIPVIRVTDLESKL